MIEIPILFPVAVFHAGMFDCDQELRSPTSLEGGHLSVSLCPEAWRSILQRPHELPLWRLTREDARFLDISRLPVDTVAHIVRWGKDFGLVKECSLVRIEAWNEPLGQWSVDTEMLQDESEPLDDADGNERLSLVTGLWPTGLNAIHPQKDPLAHRTMDFLTMAWVEQFLPEMGVMLDGIWWRDPLLVPAEAPEFGSAPRACIFEVCLHLWERRRARWTTGMDNELAAIELPEGNVILQEQPVARCIL
jgi:hypothetical protein